MTTKQIKSKAELSKRYLDWRAKRSELAREGELLYQDMYIFDKEKKGVKEDMMQLEYALRGVAPGYFAPMVNDDI